MPTTLRCVLHTFPIVVYEPTTTRQAIVRMGGRERDKKMRVYMQLRNNII